MAATTPLTGEQSIITVNSIIGTKGVPGINPFELKPGLTNSKLFARDRNLCAYCGDQFDEHDLTREHIIPFAQNGIDTWMNVVTACRPCNHRKSHRTPEQAHMPLLLHALCAKPVGRLHFAQPPHSGGPDGILDGACAQVIPFGGLIVCLGIDAIFCGSGFSLTGLVRVGYREKKMMNRRLIWRMTPLCVLLGSAFATNAWAASASQAAAVTASASTQPALMHAKLWPGGLDPKPYLVSEKLDGVRAYWDGQSLRFRSGLPVAAPGWFTAGLPKTPLDGELWLGRGRFDETSGTVRKKVPVEAEWRQLRYMIFDLPGSSGSFAERAQRITALLAQAPQPWLQSVDQNRVADADSLKALLDKTVKT